MLLIYFLSFYFFTVMDFCYFNMLNDDTTEGYGTWGMAFFLIWMFIKCCLYISSFDFDGSIDAAIIERRGLIVNIYLLFLVNALSPLFWS